MNTVNQGHNKFYDTGPRSPYHSFYKTKINNIYINIMVQVSKKCANLSKKSLIRSPQETMTEGLGTVKTLTCTDRCRLATLNQVVNKDFVAKQGTLIIR